MVARKRLIVTLYALYIGCVAPCIHDGITVSFWLVIGVDLRREKDMIGRLDFCVKSFTGKVLYAPMN
jgi:hypothetical protein